MNYNRKRHKLLKKLSHLHSKRDEINAQDCSDIGMTYNEIDKFLNINIRKRDLILSELFDSKEVYYFNLKKGIGCFITDSTGMNSFSNKKYIRKNNDIILGWLKNFVTLFIPIISLTITVIVLVYKPKENFEKLDKELQTIKQKVEYIETVQNKKENNPTFQIHKNE